MCDHMGAKILDHLVQWLDAQYGSVSVWKDRVS